MVPVLLWLALVASPALAARGPGGAVATEHPLAAGAEILGVGGSVVDAAIAAATAICVVHADGSDFALDYREQAPDAARPDASRRTDDPSSPLAEAIARAVQAHDGVVSTADLARYRPV
jgi:gamma-glutamyltranspeptidase